MFISTWFHLGFNKILVRIWIFPSCFFKRKFNCVWLTFLYYEIRACLIYSLTQKFFLTFLYFQFVKIFHVMYLFWRILNFLYKFFCKPCQWNVWYIFYIFVISLSKIFQCRYLIPFLWFLFILYFCWFALYWIWNNCWLWSFWIVVIQREYFILLITAYFTHFI